MKQMKFSKSLLLNTVTLLCLAVASAQAQEHEAPLAKRAGTPPARTSSVQLGDKVILIPDPEGFEEGTSQFPPFKARMEATEAQQNDMLLAHLSAGDCELLRQGRPATYNHYTKVSVLRAGRELAVSREMMKELVDNFRQNVGTFLDPNGPAMKDLERKVGQGLSQLDSNNTTIDFSKPQQLGEFDNRPDINSFLMLITVTASVNGAQRTVPVLATTSIVRVKERVLFVYAFMKYQANADMQTLKAFTSKWTNSIVAANAL
jgi:hypothetical protein